MTRKPIDPKLVLHAVKQNGALMAVCHVVAEGCAGTHYSVQPRFDVNMMEDDKFDLDKPKTWKPEVREERNRLQVLVQTGFLGRGAKSLRAGFKEQELDRVILGWGGVVVIRETYVGKAKQTMPTKPRGFARFEAVNAEWSKPDQAATKVPVPVALEDGTIYWIEEPRHFRRLKVSLSGGRSRWFKEYGDWRAMDAKTGKYSTGNRHRPSLKPGQPGEYKPGALPKGATPATEVMAWRTSFPGAYPYGWSGWHSEMNAATAAEEHVKLVLSYLKSGLHSVILAAANRPFDDAVANSAVSKIDTLGRGREGLASLITLSLMPSDSAANMNGQLPFGNNSDDRGKLVLHELSTKLPKELLDQSGLQDSLAARFSEAERIPAVLLGRSDSYNFATASAAWAVVNRLRFGPHHEERMAFLDRVLIEMGITKWKIVIESPEWGDNEPAAGITSVTGQLGGVSINQAARVFSSATGGDYKPTDLWWGDVPLMVVEAILNAENPEMMAKLFSVKLPDDFDVSEFKNQAQEALDAVNSKIDQMNSDDEESSQERPPAN